jgi:hypothetical protein
VVEIKKYAGLVMLDLVTDSKGTGLNWLPNKTTQGGEF